MSTDMHIVAVGARTPVGLRAESSAAAVRAGICRVRYHPVLLDGKGRPLMLALDARLDGKSLGWRRVAALASSTIAEVAAKTTHLASSLERVQVLLSLPETRPGFSEANARQVAQALSQQATRSFRRATVDVIGRGHAGALHALRVASDCLAEREGTLCVICGADSYLEPSTLAWLEEHGQLTRKGSRSGFTPGEAAGAVLVAAEPTLRSLNLRSLAKVRGVGTSKESRTLKSDAASLGDGLTKAISVALALLELPGEAVDTVYCDINGERYRTEEWGFALLRTQGGLKTTGYELPTRSWGDVGAASGALGCILAAQSWQRRYAEGPRALVFAGSEGGLRAAAVLEQSMSR